MLGLHGLLPAPPHEEPDVALSPGQDDSWLGREMVRHLGVKGFCIVGLKHVGGFEPSVVDEAVAEAQALDSAGKLDRPAGELVEGFLGEEGTGEMMMLPEFLAGGWRPAFPGQAAIHALDSSLDGLAAAASGCLADVQLPLCTRSCAVLHRCGLSLHDTVQLTDADGAFWLQMLLRQRVMLIHFLGPGRGTLELQPFGEEVAPHRVKLEPNTLAVLRSDLLSHRLTVSGESFALCAWLVSADAGERAFAAPDDVHMVPVARSLYDWSMRRMVELQRRVGSGDWDVQVPRPWRRAISHLFPSNHPVSICGDAFKGCPTWEPETFWHSLLLGTDLVREVPALRWDHDDYYDPVPREHYGSDGKYKVAVKHGSFMEGVELFDNKFFSISAGEAGGMDPQQRNILETSYAALHKAGYTKKTLMNNYIAVFTGCTNPEYMYIDKAVGALTGTGSSQAITSNRTSFVLGMMGPSSSIDCDMASSAMAVKLGATAVAPSNTHRTGAEGNSSAALCGGVYVMLTPLMWLKYQTLMNPAGRCPTFDSSSNGHVRGECCGSLCLKPYYELIDGQKKVIDDEPCVAELVGFRMTSNGRSASITAPNGPAQQQAVLDALQHAELDGLDLDAVECHGATGLIADAVEATSLAKALRGGEDGDGESLRLATLRSNAGAHMEACGIASLIKVIYSQLFNANPGGLHLKTLNPYIDLVHGDVQIIDHCVPYRQRRSFHGVHSLSIGGANAHLITSCQTDAERRPPKRQHRHKPWEVTVERALSFWPAGGGVLEPEARPRLGYFIVGSWSQWGHPENMAASGDGAYSFTVALGVDRFESFEIWLDGNPDLRLHPEKCRSRCGTRVLGPSRQTGRRVWTIDGRCPNITGARDSLPNRDVGQPGDRYKVTLHVAGKWRMVTWDKECSGPRAPAPCGSYYITGPVNGWHLEQMRPADEPGVFSAEVGPLLRPGGEFQIVRNRDFDAAFFPQDVAVGLPMPDGGRRSSVGAPSSSGVGTPTWNLLGEAGDVFHVEFRRDVSDDKDVSVVSWQLARRQELTGDQRSAAARGGFCLAGSWDSFQRPCAMRWDGETWTCPVTLGTTGEESFVLLREGSWQQAFLPGWGGAGIDGPKPIRPGHAAWRIAPEDETTEEGAEFGVRVRIGHDGRPAAVDWGQGIAFGTLGGGAGSIGLSSDLVSALGADVLGRGFP